MSLKKYLREQGYDLIDGPVRNHKPLQLWLKKIFDEVELYYSNIDHAFISDIPLIEVTNDALSVNATKKDDYGFNIGITLLEDILKSLGLGNFELSTKIKNGKKVTISYDNSITKEYPIGEIENYFSKADFRHSNPAICLPFLSIIPTTILLLLLLATSLLIIAFILSASKFNWAANKSKSSLAIS